MVTLIVSSIFIAIISQNFGSIQRSVQNFTLLANYREQHLIFLLKFEEDFHRCELTDQSALSNLDQMQFSFDLNQDGDWLDSGEKIGYRWNSIKQRIDRKSGNGHFQALLDGISGFSWKKTGSSPLCYKMTVKNIYSMKESETVYCRGSTAEL